MCSSGWLQRFLKGNLCTDCWRFPRTVKQDGPHLFKKSSPHTWNKNQVQIRNTYPWCFSNLIWNALFSLSFCLWVYLIEDKEGVSNKMPICIIWKKHPQKMHKHLNHHREDSTELRIDHHGHIYKPTSGSLLTSVAFLVHFI